jgi:hypothetical protein
MPYSLADRLNWDLVARDTKSQQNRGTFDIYGRPEYLAIAPILLGVDSRILLVGINSEGSRAGWKLGAWASQRLLISPSSTTIFPSQPRTGQRHFCRLNSLTLIEFPNWNERPYLLELEVPYWLIQVGFEVWQYSGPDPALEPDVEITLSG